MNNRNLSELFMETFSDLIEYKIGDLVYIVTDPDQHKRIVIGYELSANGMTYRLGIEGRVTFHYEFELNLEKTVF